MNERIRKLMEEVVHIEIDPDSKMETIYTCGPEDFEVFAELIVRDCLDQIESRRSSGENSDQWTITRDMCYHNMIAGLKQHFGVE